MRFDFAKHAICETSEFGGRIAVDPVFEDDPDRVAFFCLSHHRVSEVRKILVDTEDRLDWEDVQGRHWFLRPLTVEAYRKFRASINAPAHKTTSALHHAIRQAMGLVH